MIWVSVCWIVLQSMFMASSAELPRWNLMETPVKASLRGLSVVSDQVVWASGTSGVWLRTADGGNTWDTGVIAGLAEVDFRSIHALDANTAIAVSAGEPAVIYKTADGGKSWELKNRQDPPAFLDGISFADQKRGYVFGDPVGGKWMILETLDAGETWHSHATAPEAVEGVGGFAASSSTILALDDWVWIGGGGSEANLHQSSDRGVTWSKIKSPLVQGESSQGIFAMTYVPRQTLVLVGGDYTQPDFDQRAAAVFDFEAQKWLESTGSTSGYRSGVAYWAERGILISVGTNGGDLSEDSGKTWRAFSTEAFHAVRVDALGKTVWASGAGGKVGKLEF
ncbi:YCF48-related protein [Algoriphagus namhaensis]